MPASVSDLLVKHPRKTGGTQCMTCRALAKVKGSARADLIEAIDDPAYTAGSLAAVLAELSGAEATRGSMERHRREQHRGD